MLEFSDLIDVVLVAALLWLGLVWLQTTRVRLALVGFAVAGAVYALASELRLELTARILQGFSAVFVLVVIVVFQDDLRRFFEGIGASLSGSWRRRSRRDPIDAIVRAVRQLAEARMGALLVFPGLEPLARHVEGGIPLDGRVSEPLLLSLFDKHSAGHDGAIVIQGSRVERFAAHLPLSTHHEAVGTRGTRHASALGLAERCDALCVVVSEERGTVAVARDGRLRVLGRPLELAEELRAFAARVTPETETRIPPVLPRVAARWREGLVSFGVATVLWFLAIPGAAVGEYTIAVPIQVDNLPEGYSVQTIEPEEVSITLRGRRRDLLFATGGDVDIHVDAWLVQLGRRTFQLADDTVSHPEGLEVVSISPSRVRLSVASPPAPTP
ncbi:MAG: diadenylate cyclase [Proteobacteria bacterium]|nr:diadenylate cyclase [Pseudomonadota bacterium]